MTKAEYEQTKLRLEKGEIKIMEAGGFSKAPRHWIDTYQTLAEQCLDYEIENDLIPELL